MHDLKQHFPDRMPQAKTRLYMETVKGDLNRRLKSYNLRDEKGYVAYLVRECERWINTKTRIRVEKIQTEEAEVHRLLRQVRDIGKATSDRKLSTLQTLGARSEKIAQKLGLQLEEAKNLVMFIRSWNNDPQWI